jgi:hypothetical protein
VFVLTGRCGVEEAEALLDTLCAGARRVDLSGCEQLHTALLQILLAARAEIEWGRVPSLPAWLVATLSPD